MSAVRVENLSKEYVIGAREKVPETFREMLYESFLAPYRRIMRQAGGTRREERFWALKDVGFEVRPGQTVGIIGKNGAGKSTLLKILSRITAPTTGRVELHGRVSSLLEVGTGFHPELTGRENIFLNGAILGMGKAEIRKKFDEIVAFSEIETFLDTPVKRYSSGMYVRLAFAVAAHLEPEILIVDEVLGVGDTQFQRKCLGKMEEVEREGRTVLFVSHNLNSVKKLCERCILLEGGMIKIDSNVEKAVNLYLADQRATGPLVDLSDSATALIKNEVEALSIELLNPEDGAFAVRWDEPIRLKIRFLIKRTVSNMSVAIGCSTFDYVPVFTIRSSDGLPRGIDLEKTDVYEVRTVIAHNLRAGQFNIQLGVASGNYAYYYNPSVACLEILGTGTREYMENNTGLIHVRSEWEL